jgi:hypothetical protein
MRAIGPGQSARLLLDVVDVLALERIDYAVIGAMAAAVHGVIRASVDADAVVSITVRQLSELQAKLVTLDLKAELRRGDPDDPIPAMLLLSDRFGNRVDLLAGVRGLESAAFSRCLRIAFEGATLQVIGREDFIAMKVFAGGPQDLADAGHAVKVSAEHLDPVLLRRLAAKFGKETLETCERLLTELKSR